MKRRLRIPKRYRGFLNSIARGLIPLLLRLIGPSWATRVVNRHILDRVVLGEKPVIVSIWHGNIIPGVYFYRDLGAIILSSQSPDGGLAARVGQRMGFCAIRGSSSRGGDVALHALIVKLRAGGKAALTPDGPRGPAKDPKPGCVMAAKQSGAPIVPIACRAKRSLTLPSWDSLMIPLPLTRLVWYIGDPIVVPPDATDEDIERIRIELREAMFKVEDFASRELES